MSHSINVARHGTVVEIIGAVVDVEFPTHAVPKIYDALHS